MKKSEHQKQKLNYFARGVNSDISPNLSEETDGFDRGATNMRIGRDMVRKKIGGETQLYSNVEGDYSYVCIGTQKIFDSLIEVWADSSGEGGASCITVDGVIVLQSEDFGVVVEYPLQMDANESCVGGEFAFTDFNIQPFIFNLQDMLDSLDAGSEKYFTEFDPTLYRPTLEYSLSQPRFKEYVYGPGLPVGTYSYSMQYVDAEGNSTAWSPASPLIPMLTRFSSSSTIFPYCKTYGSENTDSAVGIKLLLRISNGANYSYVRLKRSKYITDAPIGTAPEIQVLTLPEDIISSDDLRYQIIAFTDTKNNTWEDYTEEEELESGLAKFNKAKSIRFFDKRLWFGNIEYPSRDLEDIIDVEAMGVTGFPVMEKLGKIGFNDPYNFTYKKSYPTGEKYGWAMQLYDETGAKSLVLSLEDSTNELGSYTMPNRRAEMTGNSLAYSDTNWKGAVTAANLTDNLVTKTFEVFDLGDSNTEAEAKSNTTHFSISGSPDHGQELAYNPLTPITSTDADVAGHQVCPNGEVWIAPLVKTAYNPQGFAPNYFSMGMAIDGIDDSSDYFPDWASGFSIMRSKRASRVVCQGIGIYSLNPDVNLLNSVNKNLNKFWCQFPDLEAGIVTSDQIQAGIDSGAYKLEVVSPLGYFSEVYASQYREPIIPGVFRADINNDFISYARLIYNSSTINPNLENWDGLTNFYTKFGKLRGEDDAPPATTKQYGIQSLSEKSTKTGRSNFYELTLESDVYNGIYAGAVWYGIEVPAPNHDDSKKWAEPWYIINIIDTTAEVPDNNINNYEYCGHYQNLRTVIGIGDNSAKSFDLASERWEDCCVNVYHADPIAQNVYIWVENDLGVYQRWLNVTSKSEGIIEAIIVALNVSESSSYTDTDGNEIYGIYTNTYDDDTDYTGYRDFSIEFEDYSTLTYKSKCFPGDGKKVQIRYDKRYPSKVFGGDVMTGENIFCPLDGQQDKDGQVAEIGGEDSDFRMMANMPFHKYERNDYYHIVKSTTTITGVNYQTAALRLDRIRQWVVMYACESVLASQYCWGLNSTGGTTDDYTAGVFSTAQHYPQINYIQRPQDWEDSTYDRNFGVTDIGNYKKIDPQYVEDFPLEFENWCYGGFRFEQNLSPTTNLDYSENNLSESNISKPKVGFKENTSFCSRVIYSAQRNINEQDDPNFKSFPAINAYDISDKQGEIKYLFDNLSPKGNNMIPFTETGICLLMINKNMLYSSGGDELGTSGIENVISPQGEIWLSTEIGVNDEMWRSIAEHEGVAFFANENSAFRLVGDKIQDLLRETQGGYLNTLLPRLKAIVSGYTDRIIAVYDTGNDEYWLNIKRLTVEKQHVFNNTAMQAWIGEFEYIADKFTNVNNTVLASRDFKTYTLDLGDNINSVPVVATLEYAIAPELSESKEIIDIDISSSTKPTQTIISDDTSYTTPSTLTTSMLRDFGGHYYGMIPRRSDTNRTRLQNLMFTIKLIHSTAGAFIVKTIKTGYKILK